MEKISFEYTTKTSIREHKYNVEWALNDLSIKVINTITDIEGERKHREYEEKMGFERRESELKYFKEEDEIVEERNNEIAESHLHSVLYNMLGDKWPIIEQIKVFADQGDTLAQALYGYFNKDIPMLETAANKGNGIACYHLFIAHSNGDDVKRDHKKAQAYLEIGVAHNSMRCLLSLRDLHHYNATKNKVNPEEDYDKALHYAKIINEITGVDQYKIDTFADKANVLRTIKKFDSIDKDKKIATIFDDGKSAKYWNVMWDENRYIISYGKVGKPGNFDFADVKDPEKEARKKADAKIKKGYVVQ